MKFLSAFALIPVFWGCNESPRQTENTQSLFNDTINRIETGEFPLSIDSLSNVIQALDHFKQTELFESVFKQGRYLLDFSKLNKSNILKTYGNLENQYIALSDSPAVYQTFLNQIYESIEIVADTVEIPDVRVKLELANTRNKLNTLRALYIQNSNKLQ